MMDVVDFQRGRELLFDHHHFLNEQETPSSEMKFSGGSDYKHGWGFPEGEGKGFVGSRTTEAELVSSSESTVEDDDYIAELTRQMTHYMLQDDDKHALKTSTTSSEKNEESWGCVSWPSDSTMMWSPLGSSSGSPEGPSQEPSPPVTPGKYQASEHKSPSYAAVLCKLDKLDMNKQGSPSGSIPVAEAENPKQCVAFDQSQDSKINFTQKQGQSSKKQGSIDNGRQPKNIAHQKFKSYDQNQKKGGSSANGGLRHPPPIANLHSNPWLNNQQGPSNMRAVFLGGSGSGSRVGTPSCGTGVFLPCVIGNTSQSPKNKRGCAPVLIPAKVVQALKVHFDRVGDQPRPNPTSFPILNDSSKAGRRTSTSANRKRHLRGAATPDMNNNEMGLPQEWTY
ncbi:uncharacterized protein LOC133733458 [Rosa rugosa]|uniref:uncharacterized protein LOC133733458 n=1 Tax=Rosa rugosa TaxID=74645 RepID=UPI002B40C5DF|nr:uncharacterized protein LOC133733458 [Rosa rugosa]